jgi:hypothetical protein
MFLKNLITGIHNSYFDIQEKNLTFRFGDDVGSPKQK